MSRVRGLGDRGGFIDVGCVPDATFKTEIDALIVAKTDVVGKIVTLTWLNNYEVTSAAQNATPDGVVLQCVPNGSTYDLTVRLFHFVDQNSVDRTAHTIVNFAYGGGTVALQDTIKVYDTAYMYVTDGGTGGWGAVISKDTTSATVDVLV
jgi:hypothetical protein